MRLGSRSGVLGLKVPEFTRTERVCARNPCPEGSFGEGLASGCGEPATGYVSEPVVRSCRALLSSSSPAGLAGAARRAATDLLAKTNEVRLLEPRYDDASSVEAKVVFSCGRGDPTPRR